MVIIAALCLFGIIMISGINIRQHDDWGDGGKNL